MRGVKGKKRKPKTEPDNKSQSRRFIKAAKALGADESGKDFDRALDARVPRESKQGSVQEGNQMTNGPYLISAIICEQIIEGKDNVLSVIRIIDQMLFFPMQSDRQSPSIDVPLGARIGPSLAQFSVLVILKSGDFKGRGKVKLVPISPTGKKGTEARAEVELFGEQHGVNLIFNTAMAPEESGLHWLEIYFEDRLLTKTPFVLRLEKSVPTMKSDEKKETH